MIYAVAGEESQAEGWSLRQCMRKAGRAARASIVALKAGFDARNLFCDDGRLGDDGRGPLLRQSSASSPQFGRSQCEQGAKADEWLQDATSGPGCLVDDGWL